MFKNRINCNSERNQWALFVVYRILETIEIKKSNAIETVSYIGMKQGIENSSMDN